ncbi:hypothetical protein [Sphingomonas sp.]|uniref:hypothetical protein n=1 Tax=Sphingomonas sp. TaxID=28214 RepID=UPI0035BC6C6B
MNGTTMVVLIVLIATIGKVLSSRRRGFGNREQMVEWMRGQFGGADAGEAQRLRDEVRQMKERIAVLERVVTDNHGSIDLDREIERLRDR